MSDTRAKTVFVRGQWHDGAGEVMTSTDPATGEAMWRGDAASATQTADACAAAREALDGWRHTPIEQRIAMVERFAERLDAHGDDFVELLSRETGKPRWESRTEVKAMTGKAALSVRAYRERRQPLSEPAGDAMAATRFKPHGVMAVLGPFNLPGHLPNGHIMPALIAGNTIVFKPSEQTPAVGERMARLWAEAGLPAGVLNLVQGGRAVGAALVGDAQIDGVLFTGSCAGGKAIAKSLAARPGVIAALEMGGNNPLIVDAVGDVHAAAYMTIVSAYITAGQRCTCARRLIVPRGAAGDDFVNALVAMIAKVRIGVWNADPQPFVGPLISRAAADRIAAEYDHLRRLGGHALVAMRRLGHAMLTPGLIDVTPVKAHSDEEHFGPLLQLLRVDDFDEAIDRANDTAFGLAAGLLSDDRARYERFYDRIRAGVVNWNRQTTGASGAMPFGGVGDSGNHRPSGYWASDYCSYPVASLECDALTMPAQTPPGIEL